MQNLKDLFAEKKIRAVYDNRTGKWWFSVADACAVINDCEYEKARNYWKWLKGTWEKKQIDSVSNTNRINFSASDGRAKFTEAMDIRGILRLIMLYPSPKAEPLRLWFADLLAENPVVISQFTEIGKKAQGASPKPTALQTIAVRPVPEE